MKTLAALLSLALCSLLFSACMRTSQATNPDAKLEASGTGAWNQSDAGTEESPTPNPLPNQSPRGQ